MPSNNARYNLALIMSHWVLALTILISLGLGWSIQYIPKRSNQMHSFILNLHTSCGIVIAILIFSQIFLRIIIKPPSYPNEYPGWQKILGYTLYILIYVSVVLMLTVDISSLFSAELPLHSGVLLFPIGVRSTCQPPNFLGQRIGSWLLYWWA